MTLGKPELLRPIKKPRDIVGVKLAIRLTWPNATGFDNLMYWIDQAYFAGLQRAKELVPRTALMDWSEEAAGRNQLRSEILTNIQKEIESLTEKESV